MVSVHPEVIFNEYGIIIIVTVTERKNYWRSQAVMCAIKVLMSPKWYDIERSF